MKKSTRTLLAKAIRFLANHNFNVNSFIRVLYLRMKYPGLSIDFQTHIEKGCKIVCVDGGRMTIRKSFLSFGTHLFADANGVISIDGTFIGRNCVIVAKEKIVISEGCAVAEMVVIRDQNHQIDFKNLESTLYNFDTDEIVIGRYVWIGAKATILKGVRVGDQSVVAASAVVTRDIPAGEIWGGIPAKFIKNYDYNSN